MNELPRIKHRPTHSQQRFWEVPTGNHGHVRTLLGDFVEDLTAKLFDGIRYCTDSRIGYCPDVSAVLPLLDESCGPLFLECKSMGRTNQTFVYEGRLAKDRKFAEHNNLFYAIWHHRCKTDAYPTQEALRRGFLTSLLGIYFIPFECIDLIASRQSPEKLNSAYGHSNTNKVYGSGFRISIHSILAAPHLFLEFHYAQSD